MQQSKYALFFTDPLPMHHRALPVSFFQEPNKVNLTSYQTLPPLQPLFRQPVDDDIAGKTKSDSMQDQVKKIKSLSRNNIL